MSNAELTDVARQAADRCALDRRAWLCIAVSLAETRTVTAAREALDDIR